MSLILHFKNFYFAVLCCRLVYLMFFFPLCLTVCVCDSPCLAECCVTIPAWDHCEVWLLLFFIIFSFFLLFLSCFHSIFNHTKTQIKDKFTKVSFFVCLFFFYWWTIQSNGLPGYPLRVLYSWQFNTGWLNVFKGHTCHVHMTAQTCSHASKAHANSILFCP